MKITRLLTSKFFIAFCLGLLAIQINISAQIAKGNFIVDGQSSISRTSIDMEGSTNFLFSAQPAISYFVSNKLAIGGRIAAGVDFTNDSGAFGLGVNARYYLKVQDKKAWFIESNLGFEKNSFTTVFTGDAHLGLDFFLNPYLALENRISLGFQQYTNNSNNDNTFFRLGTGLKFFLNYQALNEEEGAKNQWIQKGSFLVGGTVGGLSFLRNNDNNFYSFSLRPNVGYFVSNHFLIGSNGSFTIQKGLFLTTIHYGISPFGRYYFNPIGSKTALFLEGGAGFTIIDSIGNNEGFNTDANTSTTLFGGVGVNYFLTPSVALEFKLIYRQNKLEQLSQINRVGLDIGLQFYLGG